MYYLLANNKIINDGDFIFKSMGFTYTSNNSIIETLIDVDSKIEYLTCREPGCDVAHIGGRVVKSSPHLLDLLCIHGLKTDLIEYNAGGYYEDEYYGKDTGIDVAMINRADFDKKNNVIGFRLSSGRLIDCKDIIAIYKYDYENKAYLRYEINKGEKIKI